MRRWFIAGDSRVAHRSLKAAITEALNLIEPNSYLPIFEANPRDGLIQIGNFCTDRDRNGVFEYATLVDNDFERELASWEVEFLAVTGQPKTLGRKRFDRREESFRGKA